MFKIMTIESYFSNETYFFGGEIVMLILATGHGVIQFCLYIITLII